MIKNEIFSCRGWTIECTVGSMADCEGLANSERITGVRPLPDMFFQNSVLHLSFGNIKIVLNAMGAVTNTLLEVSADNLDALRRGCANMFLNPEMRSSCLGGSQVQQAKIWKASSSHIPIEVLQYAHDWTYTTLYWGEILVDGDCIIDDGLGNTCNDDFLPLSLLTDCTIPLVTFKEIDFWEDELDDNGFSRMNVKLRVMSTFWYVLMKFELRVDGVLKSRSIETRIFHEFGSDTILREFKWFENGLENKNHRVCQTVLFNSES